MLYNPSAYVPGGSTPLVSRTIQGLGYATGPARGGVRVSIAPPWNPFSSQLANARASLMTGNQLRTIANQQVGAQIKAQLGASNASSKAEQAQLAALQTRAAGLAAALGSFAPGMAQQATDAYNQSAGLVGALGSGLTAQAASDWQANADKAKQAIADATGGQGGLVGVTPSGSLANSLYTSGAALPAAGRAAQAPVESDQIGYSIAADRANARAKVDDYVQQAKDA